MKREEVGRVAMQAHMMVLFDRDFSAFDIADLHDVTPPDRLEVDRPLRRGRSREPF
jgi:hypothetical protein